MSVTMREVAEKAKVSIKTVSRVVNNEGEISIATRRRVQLAIDELNYRPNLFARGLVTQRSFIIGFIVADICNPFFAEVSRGIQDMAKLNHMHMIIANTDEDGNEEIEAVRAMDSQRVDGIIMFGSSNTDYNAINQITRSQRPIIVVNNSYEDEANAIAHVTTDIYKGGRIAVEHLVAKGHRHIGMIAAISSDIAKMRRPRAYRDVLNAHHLPFKEDYLIHVLPRLNDGLAAAKKMLINNPEITALFCYNDLMALGALRACQEIGRRVPQDCAIVGFDDVEYAAVAMPPLTTVRIDRRELGKRAANALFEMIANPGMIPKTPILDVELIEREST